MTDAAFIAGAPVPPASLGWLREVSDWRAMRDQLPALLERDGYVLLRGALPREQVMAARVDPPWRAWRYINGWHINAPTDDRTIDPTVHQLRVGIVVPLYDRWDEYYKN